MDDVAFGEGQPHWQAGVDANGLALADEERAALEVARDGGGLFVGEVAGTLVGAEGRRRRAEKNLAVNQQKSWALMRMY